MYLGEMRLHWQPLLSATLGIALGSALNHYMLSLFGPPLIAEFGWSKAEFALVGSLPLVTMFVIPFAGRFTDRFGPRIAATIGFIAVPAGFLAFTVMSGNLLEFFAIWIVQHIFGILTTTMVFARVVVERFDTARGIALSCLMTGPPLAGAVLAPIMGEVIADHGWRTALVALAVISASGGIVAVLLMGRGKAPPRKSREETHLSLAELGGLLRHPTLLLILGGMLLVNLPQVFAGSQLKLVMLDMGVGDTAATWMLSLYATGVIVGRFISGLALDRVEPHVVAIAALGLPALGFLIIATGAGLVWVLAGAVLLIGLAQGAEGDIGAYLVSRRFDMKNYSLLLSCVTMMIGVGSAIGSLILSATLVATDSYTPFLVVSAVCTILGAALFGATGAARLRARHRHVEETVVEQAIVGEIG